MKTWSCVQVFEGHGDRIWQAEFSADGQHLASCSHDQTIKLWNIQTGECLNTLTGHQGAIATLDFSPDSQTLVSGGFDRTIKLWDANTGECLKTLRGHTGRVLSVLWRFPQIISSSLDGTIKLWNPEPEICLQTLRAPRPYEDMNITRLSGVTEAQQETLRELGAIGEGLLHPDGI